MGIVDRNADDRSAGRGLSPVVGGALLIAILVLLGVLVSVLALGLVDEQATSPEAAFELDPVSDGPGYRLVHRGGGTINGDLTTVRGLYRPEALAGAEVGAGTAVVVYPEDPDLELVWTAPGGEDSYVVWRTTVDGRTYDIDEGCDWAADRTNGGSDSITVDITVQCDVVTDGSVTVDDGTVIGEAVSNDSDVVVRAGSRVYERVDSDDAVDIDDARVDGSVTSADGGVDLDNGSRAGSVDADDAVTVATDSVVDGAVESRDGSASLTGGSSVGGRVDSDDAVDVDGATVGGDLDASGDVDGLSSTVRGDVTSRNGPVTLDGATVGGEVYLDDSFSCTDSTVNGQDCGAYTPTSP